jgi:hypothetical protein
MDHVGASAKYDVVLISADCPNDYSTNVFAEYWVPQYPFHLVRQGIIKLNVKGTDKTAPIIDRVQFRGDNTIEAKISDGGKVRSACARFIMQDVFENTFDVQLKDDGTDGDRIANDHVYSKKIPDRKFGLYRIIVEAEDTSGNKAGKEAHVTFVVH